MLSSRTRAAVLTAALSLLLVGCSSSDDGDHDAHGDSSDHSGHVMNEPDATRADELEDADLRSGSFDLLETAPPGLDAVEGEVWVAEEEGTTVTAELSGLTPETDYMMHLHAARCTEDAGGDHFMFDTSGPAEPPNEVHLAFTTDAEGQGEATVTNERRVGDDAKSVVVHPTDAMDNRVACADF